MRYLITGATGFIGSEVLARLAKRVPLDDIFLLARRKPANESSLFRLRLREHSLGSIYPRLNFIETDFLNPERFRASLDTLGEGPWVVIHMAAIISGLHSTPEEQERVNVGVTRDLLEWSKARAGHFVYLSSVVAFGGSFRPRVRSEKDFDDFSSICRRLSYFRTKREAHEDVLKISQSPTTILCPSIVHGSLEHFKDSRGHLQAIRQGRLRMAPGGGGNFVGLDRVSEAIVQASLEELQASAEPKVRTRLIVDRNLRYGEYFKLYLKLYRDFLAGRDTGPAPRIRSLPSQFGPALRGVLPVLKSLGLKRKLVDVLLESSLFLFFESQFKQAPTAGLEAAILKSFEMMPNETV